MRKGSHCLTDAFINWTEVGKSYSNKKSVKTKSLMGTALSINSNAEVRCYPKKRNGIAPHKNIIQMISS